MRSRAPKGNPTLPMFAPTSSWVAPNMADLPDWRRAKRVGWDTEFEDPTLTTLGCGARRGAKLAGYSFKLDGDTRAYYVPLRHPEGNVADPEQGLQYMRDMAHHFEGELIGANMSGDLDICHYEGIRFRQSAVKFRDIQVAGPLIWELHFKYSLEAEAERRGFKGKDETELKAAAQAYGADITKRNWKSYIPKMPAKYAGVYAEHDAGILLPVYAEQERIIDSQGLRQVLDLETRLLPILLKIRQRGVRIDWDKVDQIEIWAAAEENKALEQIYQHTGIRIGFGCIMQKGPLAAALQKLGVVLGKTESGEWELTTEVLASIAHPVAKIIRYCRQVYKLRTTFVASVRRYATQGRIHGTLRQIVGQNEKNEKSGAAFGRLSHAHPNGAQEPSAAAFSSMWRSISLPEPGCEWGVIDLSQQEPRWTTHFAEMHGCRGAKEAAEAYRTDPRTDNHDLTAKMTGLERKYAKAVFLALCYGEGGAKLCKKQLKLPTRWRVTVEHNQPAYFATQEEAVAWRKRQRGRARVLEVAGEEGQKILDTFNQRLPFVRELSDICMKKVEETGVLHLLGGRILHFPLARGGEYDYSYKALNRVIQGTSGYQVKMGMIRIDDEMPNTWVQKQRHDDLAGSFSSRKEAKDVARIMTSVVRARVPFRADVEMGTSDGDIHQLCAEETCYEHAVKDAIGKYFCGRHQT